MSRKDFLVEIGTEELPPRSLKNLSEAFTSGVVQGLVAANLKHGKSQRFATPMATGRCFSSRAPSSSGRRPTGSSGCCAARPARRAQCARVSSRERHSCC